MKQVVSFLALAALVCAAVPAYAGHGEKCTADAQTCLNTMVMKMKDYGWAGLTYDKTADGAKQVKLVAPGSPAEIAGFQSGDILVALNGIELAEKNNEALGKIDRKAGSTVTYTIRRGADEKKIAVTLVTMPQDVIATNVGSHMVEGHATVATADASVAPETKAVNAKK